ncbi:hypothetical protein [Herpetosiphon sp. NSE202]
MQIIKHQLFECWDTIGLWCDASKQQSAEEHEGQEYRYAAVTE